MKLRTYLSMPALFLVAGMAFAANPTNAPATDHSQHKPEEQKKPAHGDHGHGHGQHKLAADAEFTKLDRNKDGALSRDELAKHRLSGHFVMLDADKNGSLSPKEFAAGKGM